MPAPSPIPEYDRPDISTFRDSIYPAGRPAILRGIGNEMVPVGIARKSEQEFAQYLKDKVGTGNVKVLTSKPGAGSTFFFENGVAELNFERSEMPFDQFVDTALSGTDDSTMRFMESTNVRELGHALAADLQLPIAPGGIEPRLWLGNRTGVQTHFDYFQNIACVICGRRRFTLFPPDQTPNLYMAPFEKSPSGAPISMVQLDDPDLERHPRFREAQQHAMIAELAPGDGIYIPYMWWHKVEALGSFNVLMNYWWNEYEPLGSPIEAMLHSILAIRDLPPPMRAAWQSMFETFVFKQHGEPMDHIEPAQRGGLGPLNGQQRGELWHVLVGSMANYVQRMRSGGGPR